jgi:hypothetical protein
MNAAVRRALAGCTWSFDPLGIPLFGLIHAIAEAPGKPLPSSL